MGRPSVKGERQEQILEAYESCVARFGVEGATLEKIAQEANLARPLIRHHVGNRQELLAALADRYVRKSNEIVTAMLASLPNSRACDQLLTWLFETPATDSKMVLVAEALIAASQSDPALAKKMRRHTRGFVNEFAKFFKSEFPRADSVQVQAVATGVVGIYFNVESLVPLGNMRDVREASHKAAHALVDSLRA